jgi:hypothetical protein
MTVRAAGRIMSAGASLGALAIWAVFLFRNPYGPPAQGRVLTFGSLMMLATVVATGAAVRGAHLAMYLLFVVLFFPVGLYLLGGPGIFSGIGWLNLLYLLGAMLVHRGVLTAKENGSVGH